MSFVSIKSAWSLVMLLVSFNTVECVFRCQYDAVHTLANCSHMGINVVPWNLHKNINSLDLSSNTFTVLPNQSFLSYKLISKLYLSNNSLTRLEIQALTNLKFLNILDLSNNRFDHIPLDALDSIASNLVHFFMAGNRLTSLTKGTFQKFKKLKHLDLSGNSIHEIQYGAFRGLESMEVLKLRHNRIARLPSDAFHSFPEDIKTVQLYNNRWLCDCRLRWLKSWMNETEESVWRNEGYHIRCDGPSIVKDKFLEDVPMDELGCEVEMRTSGGTVAVNKGDNKTILCVYSSVPDAEAKWLANTKVIDPSKSPTKFSVDNWATEGFAGRKTQYSKLTIKNFKYEDIARYVCFVQNIRGEKSTEYKMTLKGVDFNSVTPRPLSGQNSESSGVDTHSIVIAVAVVCGIILIIVIGIVIFCSVNIVQRRKQEKRDAIVENVKQHFLNDGDALSNGDVSKLDTSKISSRSTEKLDKSHDDDRSNSNTNDSNATAVKRPLDLNAPEPLYIFEQPASPFNNGNTYVSFGSELTDPGEFGAPPHQSVIPYPRASSTRYEGSHAGSATPLLDRYTPSVFDSDEPIEDYAQYPVYDSLTNSLHHPRHGTTSLNGDARNGNNIYGTAHRNGQPPHRMSSFHYPSSVASSVPHTPGTMRSSSVMGSKYSDYSTIGNPPRPEYNRGMSANDYRDYRDMRYPTTTPPPNRINPGQKSVSVGNLGFQPIGTGPKKPPRVFQSREYMELVPQEVNESTTSPEAQEYSQNYGITPGTPV